MGVYRDILSGRYDGKRFVVDGDLIDLYAIEYGDSQDDVAVQFHAEPLDECRSRWLEEWVRHHDGMLRRTNDALDAENANLQQRITTQKQTIQAYRDESREWREVAERAQAENAKLRTFIGGGSIVTDYWKDEDGTMHVLTTDGEQTYEYQRGVLAEENAKLRELVRDLLPCYLWSDCYEGTCSAADNERCPHPARLDQRAKELGVEVDE